LAVDVVGHNARYFLGSNRIPPPCATAKTISARRHKPARFHRAAPMRSPRPHRNRRRARCVRADPKPREREKLRAAFAAAKTDHSASSDAAAKNSQLPLRSESLFGKA